MAETDDGATSCEPGSLALDRAHVEGALAVASRAPSIYNTQPWTWSLQGDDALHLRADPSRQLSVVDPDRHSLLMSAGAALAGVRIALRGLGRDSSVERHRDVEDPDLLATVRVIARVAPGHRDELRASAVGSRFSDRRPFRAQPVPDDVLDTLEAAGSGPDVSIFFVRSEGAYVKLAVAMSRGAQILREDPEYLEELARWVHDDDDHEDGFAKSAIPHLPPEHPRRSDVALRDFGVDGGMHIDLDVDEHPALAVITTTAFGSAACLQAGEAMMYFMVEAELHGVSTCAVSQAVDLPVFRSKLQALMGWTAHPQMIVRVGYPGGGVRPIRTARRAIDDIFEPSATAG